MNYKKISPSLFAKASSDMLAVISLKKRISVPKRLKKVCALPFISSLALRGDFEEIASLSALQAVTSIASVDELSLETVSTKSAMQTPCFPHFYGDIEGIYTTCVLDSGVNMHLDLTGFKSRIIERISVIGGSVEDENGHGTMIAGLIGGSGVMSEGRITGVDRMAKIVSVKCMRADGKGDTLDILKGMQWIYDNAKRLRIKTVAMAFGAAYQGAFDPLLQGVEALYRQGLIVVSAAGNNPVDGVRSPGVSPYCLTVGAYDSESKTLERAAFSARDELIKKPEILLPGVNVVAINSLGGYSTYSGTSVSCGIAAGITQALAKTTKGLTLQRLKTILKTADHGTDFELKLR